MTEDDGGIWKTPFSRQPKRLKRGDDRAGLFVVVGGAGVLLGAFMPWMKISTGFGDVARSGMDGGDGWFFVFGGALIAYIGLQLRGPSTWSLLVPFLAAVVMGVLAFYEINDVTRRDGDSLSDVSVGWGLYLICAALLVVLVGLFKLRTVRSHR